ncbi:hypothetical protein [Methylicorpusculum sp.]|uniref:hypothetical protein n=1 Tax=Methylicorpusculum sp. TaxID=2713644 RepID=UPI002ABA7856|nr:hypothetical protein [Methylicorpusculum sp.]MDZ4149938.1 hypothetical protein [Methylicorpusculum sp.]
MNKKISTLFLIAGALLVSGASTMLTAAHRGNQQHYGSTIVQVRNADKLVFFGKQQVQITGLYQGGPLQQTAFARKPLTFVLQDPEKGQLQRLEIQNPHGKKPTRIQPRAGIQYNIKFNSDAQQWYVHQEKRAK